MLGEHRDGEGAAGWVCGRRQASVTGHLAPAMQKLTVAKQISNHVDRIDRERRTGDDQVAVDVLPEERRRADRAPTRK